MSLYANEIIQYIKEDIFCHKPDRHQWMDIYNGMESSMYFNPFIVDALKTKNGQDAQTLNLSSLVKSEHVIMTTREDKIGIIAALGIQWCVLS